MFNLSTPATTTPVPTSLEESKGETDDPTDLDKLELLLGKAARGSARKGTRTFIQLLTPGTAKK